MDRAQAERVAEVCLTEVLKSFETRGSRILASAKEAYVESGRGAYYCEVPFKTLLSVHQQHALGYLGGAVLDELRDPELSSMLRSYDPAHEWLALVRIWLGTKPNQAIYKCQIMRPGAAHQDCPINCSHCSATQTMDMSDRLKHTPCSHCATLRPTRELKKCGGCGTSSYCGSDCQRAEWPVHRRLCRRLAGLRAGLAL